MGDTTTCAETHKYTHISSNSSTQHMHKAPNRMAHTDHTFRHENVLGSPAALAEWPGTARVPAEYALQPAKLNPFTELPRQQEQTFPASDPKAVAGQ